MKRNFPKKLETPSPTPMPRRGSGADWIANKAGRPKEFEAVQKKMAEAKEANVHRASLSQVQCCNNSSYADRMPSVLRKVLRAHDNANLGAASSYACRTRLLAQKREVQRLNWARSRTDNIDEMVENLERGTVNEGMGEEAAAWGGTGGKSSTRKSNKLKLTWTRKTS